MSENKCRKESYSQRYFSTIFRRKSVKKDWFCHYHNERENNSGHKVDQRNRKYCLGKHRTDGKEIKDVLRSTDCVLRQQRRHKAGLVGQPRESGEDQEFAPPLRLPSGNRKRHRQPRPACPVKCP